MLVISRRKGQRITIGDDIEIVVTELHRSNVRLGIQAPRGYIVLRGEVHDTIEQENRAAAESTLEEASAVLDQLARTSPQRPPPSPKVTESRQDAGKQEPATGGARVSKSSRHVQSQRDGASRNVKKAGVPRGRKQRSLGGTEVTVRRPKGPAGNKSESEAR